MGGVKAVVIAVVPTRPNGKSVEQWLALKQEGDILNYRRKFIELSAPLENILEEVALGNYINGLKPEIRAEIRILEPTNFGRAMDLAQKIEAKFHLTRNRKDWGGNPNFRSGITQRPLLTTQGEAKATVWVGAALAKPMGNSDDYRSRSGSEGRIKDFVIVATRDRCLVTAAKRRNLACY